MVMARPTMALINTYPRIVTFIPQHCPMSALGQKRTFTHLRLMSALPPKADMPERHRHVRFVPKADKAQARIAGTVSPLNANEFVCLSELRPIFAGNFIQLLLRSLYWRRAGSSGYFAEKTFQPDRCNSP
jgi:hypothetical protein